MASPAGHRLSPAEGGTDTVALAAAHERTIVEGAKGIGALGIRDNAISLKAGENGEQSGMYLMMLVAVIGVEPTKLVAAFLSETVILNVANLALAVVPSEGAIISGF